MSKTKTIVRVAMYTALLIAGQVALSGVAGVEIVTVMLLCFCYHYGIRQGIAVATTFSFLRCFLVGFEPDIIALYLIYYNLFALFFGWLGARFAGKTTLWKIVIVVVCAVVFTALFTVIDDTIKILIYKMRGNAARIYVIQSLPVMATQMTCTVATVSLCFVPLNQVLKKIDF